MTAANKRGAVLIIQQQSQPELSLNTFPQSGKGSSLSLCNDKMSEKFLGMVLGRMSGTLLLDLEGEEGRERIILT